MEFSKSRARFRAWALGADGTAGAWGRDEIRDIIGTLYRVGSGHNSVVSGEGVFAVSGFGGQSIAAGDAGNLSTVTFKASRVVSTGPQNVPQHVWQPVILYLGWPR